MFYLSSEDCDSRRILSKNEKEHYSQEGRYLDRGDSKIVNSVPKFQTTKRKSAWQINRISSTNVSARIRPARYTRKKRRHSRIPKEGTALLRCNEGTFRVRKIYGDGNCMFRAISYILWRNEEEHHSLRIMVVQHIKDNWHEYGPFVMAEWNISDRQEYFDYMSPVGTFASELECTVATKLHRMNLSIYRELTHRYELKLIFHNCVNVSYDTARLLFTGSSESGHYDVLFPDYDNSLYDPIGLAKLRKSEHNFR